MRERIVSSLLTMLLIFSLLMPTASFAIQDQVDITARPSKSKVRAGEVFTIGIDFTHVNDLYTAEFSFTHNKNISMSAVEPSAELSAYQAAHSSADLYFHKVKEEDLGKGKVRSDYILTLLGDFAGYSGIGSLATFNISIAMAGDYNFHISNVLLLDSKGADLVLGDMISGLVHVAVDNGGGSPTEYTVSGNIAAQAFVEGVDYSMTWYRGEDGTHMVVVKALDTDRKLVAYGTVKADGSYSLKVTSRGNYTIHVSVPSHFGAESSVEVKGNTTVNFGPLTAGDVNGDGIIDSVDIQFVEKQFGEKANEDGTWSDAKASAANITRSGEVDMMDISFILKNYGMRK